VDVRANWCRLNDVRSSGASIRRNRRAHSRFFEIVVRTVCWFFLTWICSLVPLKTKVVISVVSEFHDALPRSFLMFQLKLDSLRFVQNGRIAEPRGRRWRWSQAAVISCSDYWEHGASLAVWLVLVAAETRSVGRDRCCKSRTSAVSYPTLLRLRRVLAGEGHRGIMNTWAEALPLSPTWLLAV
jgi:hypothetical protein